MRSSLYLVGDGLRAERTFVNGATLDNAALNAPKRPGSRDVFGIAGTDHRMYV